MSYSPYRERHEAGSERPNAVDYDILPGLVLLWLISLMRVICAFYLNETFGAEATLAALVVLLVPWLVLRESRVERDP